MFPLTGPALPSPSPVNRDTLDCRAILYGYDAEIVVNGHEHFYERFLPMNDDGEAVDDGIRQFTVGTGGGELHTRSLPHKYVSRVRRTTLRAAAALR